MLWLRDGRARSNATMIPTPAIDRRAFRSVRSYYFRDACAKSWGLVTQHAQLSDLRAVWRASHLLALDWYQRRYV
jgi:hypothetical protein